ncbi:hypothetical protein H0H81_002783 [Sphagnurus paluster]|uniref:Cyclochlorotine biosynthesis protein O n=1 Tax=Sphagnurus paluster TaxID=117069 RepID=A0A9P7FTK4_9AGAR|nr:hypothetical protein H0H81_002783 [Sphagnurus paluster]
MIPGPADPAHHTLLDKREDEVEGDELTYPVSAAQRKKKSTRHVTLPLWADLIEYEVVKFHSGTFGGEQPDVYSGSPSDEVDQAWSDLYNFGISEITEDQAQRLVNATKEVNPGKKDYIIGIDVFHQLHCLNFIRKSLYPDYYKTDNATETPRQREIHLSHCVNSIRQSLMCSADISTIVFKEPAGKNPQFDILHSCRKFDKIKEWGMRHQATTLPLPSGNGGHMGSHV